VNGIEGKIKNKYPLKRVKNVQGNEVRKVSNLCLKIILNI
jgi:hypothetical protein